MMSPKWFPGAACVLTSLLAVASLPESNPSQQPAASAASEYSFLGKTPEDVFAKFGVPDSMGGGGQLLRLHYNGDGDMTGTFVFHDDIAVQVPAPEFEPAEIAWPVPGQVHTGQRVESAILLLGNATEVLTGTHAAQLRFADGTEVMVWGGRVFPMEG